MLQPYQNHPASPAWRQMAPFLYAAAFTILFMAIDWESLNPYAFGDLENYRSGFQSRIYLYNVLNMSIIEAILNEALWVWLFEELYELTGNIEVAFSIVTTVSVLLISLFILKRTEGYVYIIFLFNPAFINLVAEQIRSGLATAIFLTAMWVRNSWIRAALLILPGMIHNSFILLSAFYVGFHAMKRIGSVDITAARPYLVMALLIVSAVLLTLWRDILLASIGDERAFEVLGYQSRVLLSFGFLSFSISYVLLSRDKSVTFESGFYLFNIVMALVCTIIGIYGSRFVAYGIPVLAVMAAHLPAERRILFFLQYAAFSVTYFFYWFV